MLIGKNYETRNDNHDIKGITMLPLQLQDDKTVIIVVMRLHIILSETTKTIMLSRIRIKISYNDNIHIYVYVYRCRWLYKMWQKLNHNDDNTQSSLNNKN